MPVKTEGFAEIDRKFAALEHALAEEQRWGAVLVAALQPAVERAKAIVGTGSPEWHETQLTRADIHAAIDRERALGTQVAASFGAGPRRAFILRFLEEGTVNIRAMPVLRPAWDAAQAEARSLALAGIKAIVNGALGTT